MRIKNIIYGILLTVFANILLLYVYGQAPVVDVVSMAFFPFLLIYLLINVVIGLKRYPSKRLYVLGSGCELLQVFSLSTALSILLHIIFGYYAISNMLPWKSEESSVLLLKWLGCVAYTVVFQAILFWNGMIRVYLTSVQMGIKHRVLAAIFGFVPIVNVWYLIKIIRICAEEVEEETAKLELDESRAGAAICKTKYPILLVHGVFFRDFHYLNYWGRIPNALKKNGAEIYYGMQQSADTVENCGEELAERIRMIVKKTGCEKVNIIAHSKGGLDSRAAISHFGAAPYVASLTTINTPHRGCIFAEYLLNRAPEKLRQKVSETYNTTLCKLGDISPDFLGAVTDLTESACEARNLTTPDMPGILYESVMSYCKRARSGKFPINITYPLVKHFDGQNDGLVSVESAVWGSDFRLVEPKGKRGISHGDMVDLNRENLRDFDVREFYVSLVSSLRERGY